MRKLIPYLIIALLLSVIAYQGISGRKGQSEQDRLNMALYESQATLSRYKIMVHGLREQVTETKLLSVRKDNIIFKQAEEAERLKELGIKRVELIGRLGAEIEVLKNKVPATDTVIIIKQPDGNYAKLPLAYSYSDRWATLSAEVNEMGDASLGAKIDSIDFNIVIGDKGGFLKRDNVAVVTTSNPYMEITDQQFMIVNNNTRPWKLVAFGSGITVAAMILLKIVL